MPQFSGSNTPEFLLGRNDSKNPATTCKGITGGGRPCRRALAVRKAGSGGVVAVVEEADGQVKDAQFYCWQHRDQAKNALEGVEEASEERERFELRKQGSIDTLVQRLGIQRVGSEKEKEGRGPRDGVEHGWGRKPRRTETRDFADGKQQRGMPHTEKSGFGRPEERRPKKRPGLWAGLCCMLGDGGDDDYVEVVRHRTRVQGGTGQPTASRRNPRPVHPSEHAATASLPARKSVATRPPPPSRPQQSLSSNSETANLLSLVPQTCSPQTASALLAELSRPPNPNDEEGYIYIFWLTPQSNASKPADSAARSLLSPPSARPRGERRVSDVMTEFSFSGSEPETRGKKTIMLKIGRASNVTRRMNEWQRQCGYALTLVRWYPYTSSSAAPSPQPSPRRRVSSQQVEYPDLSQAAGGIKSGGSGAGRRESGNGTLNVRKVSFVKRVERLIHLELAEQRVSRSCEVCGREHREWFEVEATEAGVKRVDELVRKWVEWAERQPI